MQSLLASFIITAGGCASGETEEDVPNVNTSGVYSESTNLVTPSLSEKPRDKTPPPPPPLPGPVAPPPQIKEFLRGNTHTPSKIELTLIELGDRSKRFDGPNRFLGRRIVRAIKASDSDGSSILGKLESSESYVHGDYGCVSHGIGIRLTNADVSLDFELNCGHIYFSEKGHEGEFALFSEKVSAQWQDLYRKLIEDRK